MIRVFLEVIRRGGTTVCCVELVLEYVVDDGGAIGKTTSTGISYFVDTSPVVWVVGAYEWVYCTV